MIKFRCSALANIMTGAKFTDTAKKYICEVFDSWERGVRYEFSSKETEKGLIMESEAIAMVRNELIMQCQTLKEKRSFVYEKNEKTYQNEWITGTPDVIYYQGKYKFIDDVKCSFTRSNWLFSVASSLENNINEAYYWQMQGYMMLTGAHEAYLVYCLMDTPEHIVKSMVSKAIFNKEPFEAQKIAQNIEKLHEFGDFERIHRIKVQRNDKDIEKIKQRVEMANDWIDRYIRMEQKEQNIEVFVA